MSFYLSLGILVFVLGAQVILRFFYKEENFLKKIARYIFIFSIPIIFSLLFYQSVEQYKVWSQNEVSKFLLPPHQNISYFLFYVGTRFFVPYLISLAIGLIFLFSAKILNKKYEERFFYAEEPYFGALAIFLISQPGWLFYAVFLILLYLTIHIYSLFILHKSSSRISLYYLWLPTAIFVILISKWLQDLPIWRILKL